jgi:gluconate 2-dehydrogenase gamma chain
LLKEDIYRRSVVNTARESVGGRDFFSFYWLFGAEFCYQGNNTQAACKAMTAKKKSLSAFERDALAAAADRIFPPTDTPGAVEIGAVHYIETALAGAYAALAPLYRSGLRALNRHARVKFGTRFVALSGEKKDSVLRDFESGAMPGWKKAAEFFETLRYHVLEGVFCEPRYGGNHDMSGWRLVGFPGQQFGYADAFINKRVDLEPVDESEEEGK